MAPFSPPKLRGNSSYQAACPARGRSTHSGCGADDDSRASGTPVDQLGDLVGAGGRRAAPRACSSSRRTPSAAACRRFFASAPGDLGGEVLEEPGALLQLELDVLAGGRLHLDLVAPGGVAVGPRVDHQLVEPDGRRDDRARPPVVVARVAAAPTPSARSPLRRQRTRAPRRSWPSAMSWADTGTRSPPTALAGNPAGVRGCTSSITIGGSTGPSVRASASAPPTRARAARPRSAGRWLRARRRSAAPRRAPSCGRPPRRRRGRSSRSRTARAAGGPAGGGRRASGSRGSGGSRRTSSA